MSRFADKGSVTDAAKELMRYVLLYGGRRSLKTLPVADWSEQ